MTEAERRALYRSAEWKALRAVALERAAGRCEQCGAEVVPDKRGTAGRVRHKVPIEEGGPPLPGRDGVEAVCPRCHYDTPYSVGRYRTSLPRPVDDPARPGEATLRFQYRFAAPPPGAPIVTQVT